MKNHIISTASYRPFQSLLHRLAALLLLFSCFIFAAAPIFAADSPLNKQNLQVIDLNDAPFTIERICLTPTSEPAKSQAVTWRTALMPDHSYVEYVLTEKFYSGPSARHKADAFSSPVTLDDGRNVYYHTAVLDHLIADQWYCYRVGHGTAWSEWCRFKTAPDQFKAFSFVFLGDIQNEISSMCSQIFRAAYQQVPNAKFWLIAGDFVNDGVKGQ